MSAQRGVSELERVRFAFAQMIGKTVQVQTMNGVVYEGILSGTNVGSSPVAQIGVSLEMAYKKPDAKLDAPFGGPPAKASRDTVVEKLVINDEDVAQIAVAGLDLGFRAAPPEGIDSFTDTGISGGYGVVKERTLEQWQPSPNEVSLADIGDLEGSSARFAPEEMFAVAKRDHNYQSTFNEDEYTTKLDTTNAEYARRNAEAAKIAGAIMSGSGSRHNDNVHVREDRGMTTDVNEEAKYGAVRDGKYRVPALRKPTSKAEGAEGPAAHGHKADAPDSATERERVGKELKSFANDFQLEAAGDGGEKTDASKEAPAASAAAGAPEEKKETKLNPNAQEFKFNPTARTFTPGSFSPASAPSSRAPPTSGSPMMPMGNMGMHHMPAGLPQVGMPPRGMPQVVSPYYQQMPQMYMYHRMQGGPGGMPGYPQPGGVVMPQQQMMGGMSMGPRMSMQHHHQQQQSIRPEMMGMHPGMQQGMPGHIQHGMHPQIRGVGPGGPGGPSAPHAANPANGPGHGQPPGDRAPAAPPGAQPPQGPPPSTS